MSTLAGTIVLFLVLLFAGCTGKKVDTSAEEEQVQPHPLTIDALKSRTYEASEIKVEQNFGVRSNFTSYKVSYESDGLIQYGLMNRPDTPMPSEGFPVIIVCHGYIPPTEFSTAQSYKNTSAVYASEGFLVLKPDYRGHGDSQGRVSDLFRTIYYSIDVLNLIAALPSLEIADLNRIYMYGHSMGGEVALRVLEISGKIKAATIWAPATAAFPENILYFMRKWNMEETDKARRQLVGEFSEEGLLKFAPIENTHLIDMPVLLHHGTEDESVPYEWGLSLVEKFEGNGVVYKFYTYIGGDHNLSGKNFFTAIERDVAFFNSDAVLP